MAINDQTSSSAQAQAQAHVQAAPAQQQAVRSAPIAWSGTQGILGRLPIERNRGSEFLSKLQTSFKKLVDEANTTDWEIATIAIDNAGDTGLKYSTLIVTLRSRKLSNLVAFHSLVLEATAEPIAPRFENFNNQQVEIFRTASDAYDREFINIVANRVRSEYPQSELTNAEAAVVPRTFDLNDEAQVRALFANALYAAHNELVVRSPDFVDMCVGAAGRDTSMRVTHRFERQQIPDACGQPIRSDVVVSFTTQQNSQQQNQSVNSGAAVKSISTISGFIDLVYAPLVAQQHNVFTPNLPMQMQNPNAFVRYAARMVMTNIETNVASTLPSQLLAIASAVTLNESNSWFTTFYQHGTKTKKNQVDYSDIGAIGYEVNISPGNYPDNTIIDTKSNNWNPADLGTLLTMTVQQGLALSMDVPDCGPQTWYTNVFAAAAGGHPDAVQAIIAAANVLTDNNFKNHFPSGASIFADSGMRIHLGVYRNAEGVLCDIRDLDYLAVLNLMGKTNPDVVKEWSNTFNFPMGSNINERLSKRKSLIMGMISNAELTGYATRVTFNSHFIKALATGIAETGMKTSMQTPMGMSDFSNQRGVASINDALMPAGPTPFIQNYGGPMAQGGGASVFNGRWTR